MNVLLHAHGVSWRGGRMAGMSDIRTRFYDPNASVGTAATPHGSIRLTMLAHSIVPRACPVLSPAEMRAVDAAMLPRRRRRGEPRRPMSGKAMLWHRLLRSAYVLHCFPPGCGPNMIPAAADDARVR